MSISIPETELKSSALFAAAQRRRCGGQLPSTQRNKEVHNHSKVQGCFSLQPDLSLLVYKMYKFQNSSHCDL